MTREEPMTEIDLTPEQYGALLTRAGNHPREVDRAVAYVTAYGFEAMDSPGCVVFRTPTCGDWNCINPEHQDLGEFMTVEEQKAMEVSLDLHLTRRERRAKQRRDRKR